MKFAKKTEIDSSAEEKKTYSNQKHQRPYISSQQGYCRYEERPYCIVLLQKCNTSPYRSSIHKTMKQRVSQNFITKNISIAPKNIISHFRYAHVKAWQLPLNNVAPSLLKMIANLGLFPNIQNIKRPVVSEPSCTACANGQISKCHMSHEYRCKSRQPRHDIC